MTLRLLETQQRKQSIEIARVLVELLRSARRGELIEMYLTGVRKDGSVISMRTGTHDFLRSLGALEVARQMVLRGRDGDEPG